MLLPAKVTVSCWAGAGGTEFHCSCYWCCSCPSWPAWLPPSLEACPLLLANQVLCAAAGEHELYQDCVSLLPLCCPFPSDPQHCRPRSPPRAGSHQTLCSALKAWAKWAPQQRSSWPWGKVVLIIIITIKRILSLLVILNMSLKISLIFLLFLNPSLLQSGDYVSSSHFTF